jgi:hypothetical protein
LSKQEATLAARSEESLNRQGLKLSTRHAPFDAEGGVMLTEKPIRRMTLRQLLTHAEKYSRDLIEHFNGTFLPKVTDFRDLSRPVRRKSHFPTLLALLNALRNLESAGSEITANIDHLTEQMKSIREHASRERINRA